MALSCFPPKIKKKKNLSYLKSTFSNILIFVYFAFERQTKIFIEEPLDLLTPYNKL